MFYVESFTLDFRCMKEKANFFYKHFCSWPKCSFFMVTINLDPNTFYILYHRLFLLNHQSPSRCEKKEINLLWISLKKGSWLSTILITEILSDKGNLKLIHQQQELRTSTKSWVVWKIKYIFLCAFKRPSFFWYSNLMHFYWQVQVKFLQSRLSANT